MDLHPWQKLLDISLHLAQTRMLEPLLDDVLHSAIDLVQAETGQVALLDADGNLARCVSQGEEGLFNPAMLKQAVSSAQPLVIADPYPLLCAPLIAYRTPLGAICVQRHSGDSPFDAQSVELMARLAAQAAVFIENVLLSDELETQVQARTDRLQILHEIDQAILGAQSPSAIAMAVLGRIRYLIPCQLGAIVEFAPTGENRLLAVEADSDLNIDVAARLDALHDAVVERPMIRGAADLAGLTHRTPLQQRLYRDGVRSYLFVPLLVQSTVTGVLTLESHHPGVFTAEHVNIAAEVAASLAVAIQQTQLRLSLLDSEAALRQYAADLETQNAELDAFAHTVAHDLKNPLTTMMGYCEFIQIRRERFSAEELDKSLDVILQGGDKICNIVDELLLLASVRKQDEVKVEPLNMQILVDGAQDRLANMIWEYQAEIVMPEMWPAALGYGPWVEEVWANYISNAIKYGGSPALGIPPRVELGSTHLSSPSPDAPGSMIRFWVRDNGAGIETEAQTKLFTPFTRLGQAHIEGQGLGLSIVQRIVDKLGGQVGVYSKPGQGSIFYFTLPAFQ
ncbi:MAG: GAF domain-containing protein [Anaerolineae bacterium]|nr:GAF domain-containing protein [Anaerolineae bacterium]